MQTMRVPEQLAHPHKLSVFRQVHGKYGYGNGSRNGRLADWPPLQFCGTRKPFQRQWIVDNSNRIIIAHCWSLVLLLPMEYTSTVVIST